MSDLTKGFITKPADSKPNPKARMETFGGYKAVYDIQPLDEDQKIWRGRPVIEARGGKSAPPGITAQMQRGWVIFSRRYDDRSDWDRMYPEITLDDKLFGAPILLIPKEKLLFTYDEPTSIELPPPGMTYR